VGFVEVEDYLSSQALFNQLGSEHSPQYNVLGGVDVGLSVLDPLPFQPEIIDQNCPQSGGGDDEPKVQGDLKLETRYGETSSFAFNLPSDCCLHSSIFSEGGSPLEILREKFGLPSLEIA
jgi:hypothetical protein